MILRMQKLILTFKFLWIFKIQVGTGGVIAQTPPLLGQSPKNDTFFFDNSPYNSERNIPTEDEKIPTVGETHQNLFFFYFFQ